jgi:hypothetical protein
MVWPQLHCRVAVRLGSISPDADDTHREANSQDPSADSLDCSFTTHRLLDTFAVHINIFGRRAVGGGRAGIALLDNLDLTSGAIGGIVFIDPPVP